MSNHWLFKDHPCIENTGIDSMDFRKQVEEKSDFKLAQKITSDNLIFDWDNISPCFKFFFDYEGCEAEIKDMLLNSELVYTKNVYVETLSNIPIIKVPTEYFIQHWNDFIFANAGMGSFVISDDFKCLLEFTDDRSFYLYSNFKIENNL